MVPIKFAKAKCKYLEYQAAPKFEPTDIVPLVNMMFPKSFGRQQNVVKAITSQGWNPLITVYLPLFHKGD
jgi:hypothetical protein